MLAVCLLFLAPSGSQYMPALAASAAALALLTAAAHCARLVLLVGPAEATQATVAAWSSARDAAFQPQRDPDAAGKPRPRAPGTNPQTV
jgi:hypothetical protein